MLITPEAIEAAKRIKVSLARVINTGSLDRYFYVVNRHDKIVDIRPHRKMPGLDNLVTTAARKEHDV